LLSALAIYGQLIHCTSLLRFDTRNICDILKTENTFHNKLNFEAQKAFLAAFKQDAIKQTTYNMTCHCHAKINKHK